MLHPSDTFAFPSTSTSSSSSSSSSSCVSLARRPALSSLATMSVSSDDHLVSSSSSSMSSSCVDMNTSVIECHPVAVVTTPVAVTRHAVETASHTQQPASSSSSTAPSVPVQRASGSASANRSACRDEGDATAVMTFRPATASAYNTTYSPSRSSLTAGSHAPPVSRVGVSRMSKCRAAFSGMQPMAVMLVMLYVGLLAGSWCLHYSITHSHLRDSSSAASLNMRLEPSSPSIHSSTHPSSSSSSDSELHVELISPTCSSWLDGWYGDIDSWSSYLSLSGSGSSSVSSMVARPRSFLGMVMADASSVPLPSSYAYDPAMMAMMMPSLTQQHAAQPYQQQQYVDPLHAYLNAHHGQYPSYGHYVPQHQHVDVSHLNTATYVPDHSHIQLPQQQQHHHAGASAMRVPMTEVPSASVAEVESKLKQRMEHAVAQHAAVLNEHQHHHEHGDHVRTASQPTELPHNEPHAFHHVDAAAWAALYQQGGEALLHTEQQHQHHHQPDAAASSHAHTWSHLPAHTALQEFADVTPHSLHSVDTADARRKNGVFRIIPVLLYGSCAFGMLLLPSLPLLLFVLNASVAFVYLLFNDDSASASSATHRAAGAEDAHVGTLTQHRAARSRTGIISSLLTHARACCQRRRVAASSSSSSSSSSEQAASSSSSFWMRLLWCVCIGVPAYHYQRVCARRQRAAMKMQ